MSNDVHNGMANTTPKDSTLKNSFVTSPVARLLIYLLAMSTSLLTTAIILVEILYRTHVRPQLEANIAVQKNFLASYLTDLKRLNEVPLFRSLHTMRAGQADAGVFLNAKAHWTPQPAASINLRARGASRQLVSPNIRETLLRMNDEWMRKHLRVKTMNADLTAFTGLERFDYWDIESESPISDLADRKIFVAPAHLPVPDVQDLLALAKLRFMMAAVKGESDFLPALNDIRQLAKLLLTTENQQLILTALALFDIERFAYNYFVTDRKMSQATWTPIDRELNQIAQKAIHATRGYLRLWTPANILEQIFNGEPAPIGFCAAVNEALPQELSLRHLLEPQMPLEIKLKSEYVSLDAIYRRAHSLCRLRYLGEMKAHDSFTTRAPGPLVLNRLPWARKVFALRLSVFGFRNIY
jgi:hypothetical protein